MTETLGGHPETNILGKTFYSQAPIRYGDYLAKVAVAPVSKELRALTQAALNVNGKPNGLRDAVKEFFGKQSGVWELRAQLFTNLETMPIEASFIPWPEDQSPYVTVGRITAQQQDVWSLNKTRSPLAPNVPTAAESGYPDLAFDGVAGFFGWRRDH